jgi:hypothetical protein
VLLVAGLTTRLEEEIQAHVLSAHKSPRVSEGDGSDVLINTLDQYVGVPKALLPGPNGKPLINNWWTLIQSSRTLFSDVRADDVQCAVAWLC